MSKEKYQYAYDILKKLSKRMRQRAFMIARRARESKQEARKLPTAMTWEMAAVEVEKEMYAIQMKLGD